MRSRAAVRALTLAPALILLALATQDAVAQCAVPSPTDLATLDLGVSGEVRVVYFTPNDRSFRACVDEHLDTFVRLAESFFREEMLDAGHVDASGRGRTFEYEKRSDGSWNAVYIVGQHEAAWYQAQGGFPGGAAFDEVYKQMPAAFRSNNVVFYVYDLWERSGTQLLYTGQGGSSTPWEGGNAGYVLQGSHFLGVGFDTLANDLGGQATRFTDGASSGLSDYDGDGNLGVLSRGDYASTALGAALHELGHAFALNHDFADYDNDGIETNLMGNGFRRLSGRYTPAGFQPPTSLGEISREALGVAALFGGSPCAGATVDPLAVAVGPTGSTGALQVTAPAGCTWTASSGAAWIEITAAVSGTGTGTVAYAVAANDGPARTGTLSVAGATVAVSQSAGPVCTYAIQPSEATFDWTGGIGEVVVDTAAGCAWTTISNDTWIEVVAGGSRTGPGNARYRVAELDSPGSRTGSVSVAGRTHGVRQTGRESCTYSIIPGSLVVAASAHMGRITVETLAHCRWTATSDVNWMVILSGTPGLGSGFVDYAVAENTSVDERSGTATIAEQTFSLRQAGASADVTIGAARLAFPAIASAATVAVTAAGGGNWFATSASPWIVIEGAGSGTGDGLVGFSVLANDRAEARSGRLLVGDETLVVLQDSAAPSWLRLFAVGLKQGVAHVGVLARSVGAAAEGLWVQLYDAKGLRRANRAPESAADAGSALAVDVDGDGRDEFVVLSAAGRLVTIEVRRVGGQLVAERHWDAGATVVQPTLFALDADGDGTREFAVGYAVADRTGHVEVLRTRRARARGATSELEVLESRDVVTSGVGLSWDAADFDGDGRDEIFVGYSTQSGGGARYRVVEVGGRAGKEVVAATTRYRAPQWALEPFGSTATARVLCGAQPRGMGRGLMVIHDASGARIARGRTGRGIDLAWRTLLPGAPAETGHRIVVGMRRSDSTWGYELWSAGSGLRRIASASVLPAAHQVDAWLVGDFDREAGNGEELVVISTDTFERSVHASVWEPHGGRLIGAALLFPGIYIAPSALAVRATRAESHDLAVVARRLDGLPRLALWDLQTGPRLLFAHDVLDAFIR